MLRVQIQLKRREEAWGNTLAPISDDPPHDKIRIHTQGLSADEWRDITPTQALTAVNERRRQAHRLPLTKNLTGLRFDFGPANVPYQQ